MRNAAAPFQRPDPSEREDPVKAKVNNATTSDFSSSSVSFFSGLTQMLFESISNWFPLSFNTQPYEKKDAHSQKNTVEMKLAGLVNKLITRRCQMDTNLWKQKNIKQKASQCQTKKIICGLKKSSNRQLAV